MKKVMQSTEIPNATTTFSTIDQPVGARDSGTRPIGQPIAAKQRDNALLDAALSYARRGLLVFPLHNPVNGKCSCGKPNCKDIGKHPRTAHGLKDATTDTETIRGWWETSPDANIAIRTGEESNLLVIDLDPRHGGNESLPKLEGELGMLPVTPSVCTGGGGGHLWHAHPGVPIKNKTDLGLGGVDIRGDGGYVVVPPSLHASGDRYRWKDGQTLSDLPLATLPDGWLKYLASKPSPKASERGAGKVGEGSRNSTLTQLAGSMRRWGASASTIVAALHVHNNDACDPPLEESEVESIANSIAGYQPGLDSTDPVDQLRCPHLHRYPGGRWC
jgi:Bifunctional DNA primase/polymerase, N-terminal/Primase C terminal 1 (PriCT-1)